MKVLNDLARASGRRIKRLRYRTLIFASMAIVVGFIAGMNATNIDVLAQSNDKNISLGPRSFIKPQIKIKEGRVGDKSRKFDENFKEDSDWLQHMSFQIENVSDKPMVYLRINVLFPETRASGDLMAYPITFGQRPGSKLQKGDPWLFLPKDTLDVSLASKHNEISRFVSERHSIESMNRIQLEVSFIVFEDGTAWSVGAFMRQDPNKPGRYIPNGTSHPEGKP